MLSIFFFLLRCALLFFLISGFIFLTPVYTQPMGLVAVKFF